MFKHILLPTDGSELSQHAVLNGIEFARQAGARVTACHAANHNELTQVFVASGAISKAVGEQVEKEFKDKVEGILNFVSEAAQKAGVPCQTRYVNSPDPFAAIIETADKEGCDLIFLASHGRKGLAALVLGSETNKVLTHAKVPVLVYR
jgi:nucleotide-binding universal stress UspA family protein